jgi:uncharacterized protein
MYKGSIVSDDGTATLIIFTLKDGADVKIVANKVIEKTRALHLPEMLYYSGAPMLVTYISDLMRHDLVRLLPIAFLVIALVLLISFRSFNGLVLPILTSLISIVWTLGVMSVLGYKMSMISNNIPIILLAVGSAYTIHVVNRISQLRKTDPDNAIQKAMESVIVPVILAAVTTVIGFLSFIFGSYLQMIIDFGMFTALGTFLALLISVFFVPAILAFFPQKKSTEIRSAEKPHKSWISESLFEYLKKMLFNHPKAILITWAVLLAVGITGIFSIQRSVDIQDYFKKGNPTRLAEQIMVRDFGGTKPVFVQFIGDMQSPEVLNKMLETCKYMEKSPDIYTTQSIATLISQLNFAVTGTKEIPDSREKIEQLWFLLDGNEVLQRFVSEDLTEGIIITKFKSADNVSKKIFSAYMRKFIAENSTENCKIQITGMPFIDITMDRSLINSQFGSIVIAVIFVIIFVGWLLRSMAKGIYAAIPIVASIVILFGFMGLVHIPLNIATVLVASVALGIGIDYSCHFMSHFNDSFQLCGDTKEAISRTISISGKAIIINVISVSAGFLVLIFSDMVPLQYFGLLLSLSMLGSSLGAMTLLPVILILVNRKNQKKIINQS